jgi:hypothetical protein
MEEQWKAIPENLPARQAVVEMRNDLRQLYFEIGACHLQIGKWYPYKSAIKSEGLWNLLEGVKTVVDPQRLMNPGCLGF